MKINPDKLTFREIFDIEDKAGLGIDDALRSRSSRALAAFVWVVKRREQPGVTWDDVLDMEISVTDAVFAKAAGNGLGVAEDDGVVDPTELDAVEAGST